MNLVQMRIIHTLTIASSLALGLAAPSVAATIVNGGFESPVLLPGTLSRYVGGQNLNGWTVLGNDVQPIQTTFSESDNGVPAFTAQEGLNSLDITGSGNTGLTNGIQQSISTNNGETYRLSFYVGVAKGDGQGFYDLPSVLSLSINGGTRTAFTNSNLVQGQINWAPLFQDFTATSSSTTIAFFNGVPAGSNAINSGNNFVGLDNVQISTLSSATAVPEPFTAIGTLISGTTALRMRRKLKSTAKV
jgi:Carbohydrate binding domain